MRSDAKDDHRKQNEQQARSQLGGSSDATQTRLVLVGSHDLAGDSFSGFSHSATSRFDSRLGAFGDATTGDGYC